MGGKPAAVISRGMHAAEGQQHQGTASMLEGPSVPAGGVTEVACFRHPSAGEG